MNQQEMDWTQDADLPDLERALAGLPLRDPPASLDRRIRRMLRRASFLQQAKLAGLGAAAMLVVSAGTAAVVFNHYQRVPQAAPSEPVHLEKRSTAADPDRPVLVQHTTSQTADGIIGIGQTPLQVLRRQSIQQAWLIDPKTGARMLVTVPREQVMLRRVEAF